MSGEIKTLEQDKLVHVLTELNYDKLTNLDSTCFEYLEDIIDKLNYYEDLENRKLLIILPCPIGTEKFYIQKNVRVHWDDKTNCCKYFHVDKNGNPHKEGCGDCTSREENPRVRKHNFSLSTAESKVEIYKFQNTFSSYEEALSKLDGEENGN